MTNLLENSLLPIHFEPIQVERITVAIADLVPELAGTKIVQLSDFHFDGGKLPESILDQAITFSNHEQPDLVVLTGDYVTEEPEPVWELAQRLQTLQSRCGIVAVLGNHDHFYDFSRREITAALQGVGIEVLWNAIATPLGPQCPVIGLADYWSGEFAPQECFPTLSVDTPRIVLSHNPDTAKVLARWRVDLQLSGHTHGGQIQLPYLGPLPAILQPIRRKLRFPLPDWLPWSRPECAKVVDNWQWHQGWYQIGDNQLYVNRGLGTYFPGRWACPPEVTVITLVPAKVSPKARPDEVAEIV